MSFWYGTEIAASPCQRKFPSREKRKPSFKNTVWGKKRDLCGYIFLRLVPHGYGWRRKIGKFSWQWDRRGPTRHSAAQYWKGRRNLSSQLRLNQYKHQNSFSIHSEATPAPTNILQVPMDFNVMAKNNVTILYFVAEIVEKVENCCAQNVGLCIELWWIWLNLAAFAKSNSTCSRDNGARLNGKSWNLIPLLHTFALSLKPTRFTRIRN